MTQPTDDRTEDQKADEAAMREVSEVLLNLEWTAERAQRAANAVFQTDRGVADALGKLEQALAVARWDFMRATYWRGGDA